MFFFFTMKIPIKMDDFGGAPIGNLIMDQGPDHRRVHGHLPHLKRQQKFRSA